MEAGLLGRIGLCALLIATLPAPSGFADRRRDAEQAGQQDAMTQKDINVVLKDHEKNLLALPGVVGLYVGLLPDDKTPCLTVMVVKRTPDLDKRIPTSIEGYPVVIEESGVIRPLK